MTWWPILNIRFRHGTTWLLYYLTTLLHLGRCHAWIAVDNSSVKRERAGHTLLASVTLQNVRGLSQTPDLPTVYLCMCCREFSDLRAAEYAMTNWANFLISCTETSVQPAHQYRGLINYRPDERADSWRFFRHTLSSTRRALFRTNCRSPV